MAFGQRKGAQTAPESLGRKEGSLGAPEGRQPWRTFFLGHPNGCVQRKYRIPATAQWVRSKEFNGVITGSPYSEVYGKSDQIRSGTQRPRVSPDLSRPQPHAAPASGGLYTGVDSLGDVGPGAGAATIPRTPTGSALLPWSDPGKPVERSAEDQGPPPTPASLPPCSILCLAVSVAQLLPIQARQPSVAAGLAELCYQLTLL